MRLLLICALSFASFAVWSTPQAYFHYKVFYTPDHQPYVSTSIQFSAGTYKYTLDEASGNLFAKVQITQVFRWEDSIIVADKYILDSPLMKDSVVEDFFDVQHYSVGPGIYEYELKIKDMASGEEVSAKQSLRVDDYSAEEVMFSDVEFIQDAFKTEQKSNFVKNGLFMLPYLTNYFPPDINKIAFYTEVYNAQVILGDSSDFFITYSISDYDTGKRYDELFNAQKKKVNIVNPIIGHLPIETLPSGNYNLELNIIDQKKDTVASEIIYFQRRNDIMNEPIAIKDVQIDESFMSSISRDSIPYFLQSIMPIAQRYEYESIRKLLKTKDTTDMEKYFYAFWLETDAKNPKRAWDKYRAQVYYAERMFGTQIKFGFETDRGRTHLKYGSPNSVIDRPNEPSAYPYQIWHYVRIGQRSNVRFIFYNPDLVTNDYPMLHSDMQGELQNFRWQQELHKRNTANTNLDDPGGTLHFGGNAGLLYTNP